jgi:hypothetical protein
MEFVRMKPRRRYKTYCFSDYFMEPIRRKKKNISKILSTINKVTVERGENRTFVMKC